MSRIAITANENLIGEKKLSIRFIRSINNYDVYGLCDGHISKLDWLRVTFKKDTFFEKGFTHKENVCYHTTSGERVAYGLKRSVTAQISSIAFHYDYKWYYVMYNTKQLFGYRGVNNEELPIKTFLQLLGLDEDLRYATMKDIQKPYLYEVVWEGTNWRGIYHNVDSEQRLTRDFNMFPMTQYEIDDWKETTKTQTTPNAEIVRNGLLKYIKNKFKTCDLVCNE